MAYKPEDLQTGSDIGDLINDLRGALDAVLALSHPGYVPGRRYGALIHSAAASGTMAANTLYAFPIPVCRPTRITGLATRVSTGVTDCTARFALYENVNGVPGRLITECNNDADASTSATELLGTFAAPLALDADMYWGAVAFNGAAIISAASPSITGANGLSYYIGGALFNNLVTATPNCRMNRTATLTYVPGAPFMPGVFGPVTYATTAPGSPMIGFVAG